MYVQKYMMLFLLCVFGAAFCWSTFCHALFVSHQDYTTANMLKLFLRRQFDNLNLCVFARILDDFHFVRHKPYYTSYPKCIAVKVEGIHTLKYTDNLCLAVTCCQFDCGRVLGVCKYKDKYETVYGVNNEGFAICCQTLPDHSVHTGDYFWGSDMPMARKSVHNYYYTDFKGTVGVINLQEYSHIQENSRLILCSATFQKTDKSWSKEETNIILTNVTYSHFSWQRAVTEYCAITAHNNLHRSDNKDLKSFIKSAFCFVFYF